MCFAVTEPDSGLDTSRLKTTAKRTGDYFTINGRKIWTSTAQVAKKIMILARTSPRKDKNSTDGLSLFYTDFNHDKIETKIISKMGRKAVDSNMLFIDDLKIPANHLLGRIPPSEYDSSYRMRKIKGVVHDENTFNCELCDKSFTTQRVLNLHIE